MCLNPLFVPARTLPVQCGKCIECCMSYSNMWSQRIMDEASLYENNCMITLTYAETDGNLCKRDLQLFVKRLRDRIKPHKIRYYACGEYGGKGNRPHYHIIVFNWFPHDAEYVKKDKSGVVYYSSEFVFDVWGKGYISVGNVTINSAKYCAKYLAKIDPRIHSVPPFTLMSRRPGIGADIVNPEMLVTGERFFDGKRYKIPKYYLDKLEQMHYNADVIKAVRKNYIRERYGDVYTYNDLKKTFKRKREIEDKYFR